MFLSNNRPSFHLWWKGNLGKHREVSKYFKTNCRSLFSLKEILTIVTLFVFSLISPFWCGLWISGISWYLSFDIVFEFQDFLGTSNFYILITMLDFLKTIFFDILDIFLDFAFTWPNSIFFFLDLHGTYTFYVAFLFKNFIKLRCSIFHLFFFFILFYGFLFIIIYLFNCLFFLFWYIMTFI